MDTPDRRGQSLSIVGGAFLVLLGTLFLLQRVVDFDFGRISWPFFVIIPGLLLLAAMAFGDKASSWLAVPGCIVTALGFILLFQALTGRYETWAYVWTLGVPAAAGAGILLMGLRDEQPSRVVAGRTLIGIGLGLFLALGAFFEMLIFRGSETAGALWPLALIAVGLVLLFGRVWWPART